MWILAIWTYTYLYNGYDILTLTTATFARAILSSTLHSSCWEVLLYFHLLHFWLYL